MAEQLLNVPHVRMPHHPLTQTDAITATFLWRFYGPGGEDPPDILKELTDQGLSPVEALEALRTAAGRDDDDASSDLSNTPEKPA